MATYRQLHISYWQDPYVEELKPLEKYFYVYLLTNSRTKQCGCYEISMKCMKYETGLTETEINKYMNMLQQDNRIRYDEETNEVLILKWLKHNSFTSPKVQVCINKELELIKNSHYREYIDLIVNQNTAIDSLSVDYTNTIDTSTQKKRKEENKKEKEEEKKAYADYVKMTEDEYQKLIAQHGESVTEECIRVLDNYKGSHDKKYKSDYRAILSWVVDRVKEKQPKKEKKTIYDDLR